VRRVLVVALLLFACAPPAIDGRDAEHARTSIIKVRDSLPQSKAKEFDDSLKLVLAKAADVPTLSNARVLAAINGKNGEQIIAAAAELRRATEEAKLQADAAAIKATLNNIHESDRAAAEKLVLSKSSDGTAPADPKLTIAALTISEDQRKAVMSSADPEIKARCSQIATANSIAELDCVKSEMHGKAFVNGMPVAGVSEELGMRIRANCAAKYPQSYMAREACENTDAGAIKNVAMHPDVMGTLRPERQAELRMLMGAK